MLRLGTLPLLLGVLACSGSGASSGAGRRAGDGGTGDGAVGVGSAGAVLAHEMNTLIEQAFNRRCSICPPCGAFHAVGPEGDTCGGIVLDRYPDSKPPFLCRIEAERRYRDCLARALDCAGAESCDAIKKTDDAACPVFTGDTSGLTLPAACTQ